MNNIQQSSLDVDYGDNDHVQCFVLEIIIIYYYINKHDLHYHNDDDNNYN